MRRWLPKLSPLRLGMLFALAALCLVLQTAGIGTRLGVVERRGAHFYVLPFDSIRIDNLNTSSPGLRFAVLGVEFNKLYGMYRYPWHARVSPFWVIFVPTAVLALFVPPIGARKTLGLRSGGGTETRSLQARPFFRILAGILAVGLTIATVCGLIVAINSGDWWTAGSVLALPFLAFPMWRARKEDIQQ